LSSSLSLVVSSSSAVVFANICLELKQQLAQTLAAFFISILTGPRRPLDPESAVELPLRQIIEVLQLAICTHDAEKLAISVFEIHRDSHRDSEV